jgi:glycosyltransferase involved in cell wall biosynthesis
LLRAFSAAKEDLWDIALVIVGPGDEKTVEKLRSLTFSLGIGKDVVWVGPLYGDAKWNVLQAAETYILPSHQENFGISVVEALACGTPVLISDKVNIWREIEASAAGFVAPDTTEGTISLLREWISLSSIQKSEMKMRAKQCFERHFDVAVTSDRYFSLLAAGAPRSAPASERVAFQSR